MNNLVDMTKLMEVEQRVGSEKVQLKYIRYLYNKAETVQVPPNWENCFNVCVPPDTDIEADVNIILSMAAAKLVHSNKIAIQIVKMKNAIFVKTEDANV